MTQIIQKKIKLHKSLPPVLGVGAYLKNSICLIQKDEAWISKEVGSLDNPESIKEFYKTAEMVLERAEEKPVAIAHDYHPDFPCTIWAKEAGQKAMPVQHHHAHAAAVVAEHQYEGKALAVILDGFGLGEKGEAWGGELLKVDRSGYKRVGHLAPLHQPGGDLAARQPWRMGAAAIHTMGRGAEIAKRFEAFDGAQYVEQMIGGGTNVPLTTSGGRLFDAACGLLDVKPMAAFEGEAPMALEAMACEPVALESGYKINDSVLDMMPTLERLVDLGAEEGANLFHGTLAVALIDWFKKAAQESDIKTIVFGGGCFFNKVLRDMIERESAGLGLKLLWPDKMLAGDQAIALGQAYASSVLLDREKE